MEVASTRPLANVPLAANEKSLKFNPVGRREAELRDAAGKLVAQTFFGTLMRQIRQSPFRSELFSGGQGGAAFQQMLDGMLVEKSAKGLGGKLVDTLVKQWLTPPSGTRVAAPSQKTASVRGMDRNDSTESKRVATDLTA